MYRCKQAQEKTLNIFSCCMGMQIKITRRFPYISTSVVKIKKIEYA